MVDSSDRGHSSARQIPPVMSAMLRASDGILELLPIATFICDAKGTILEYNRHAVAVWGRAPDPGQTHDQFRESARFYDMDGAPVSRSMVSEVLAGGTPVRNVERIVERADGTRLIVSVNVDPLRNVKGELVGAVNCFLDITERKRADAALEHSRLHALEQEQRTSCASMKRFAQSPALAANICSQTNCLPTPTLTMPIPIAKDFASRSPASSNFIQ